jgi:hypothetical protein
MTTRMLISFYLCEGLIIAIVRSSPTVLCILLTQIQRPMRTLFRRVLSEVGLHLRNYRLLLISSQNSSVWPTPLRRSTRPLRTHFANGVMWVTLLSQSSNTEGCLQNQVWLWGNDIAQSWRVCVDLVTCGVSEYYSRQPKTLNLIGHPSPRSSICTPFLIALSLSKHEC